MSKKKATMTLKDFHGGSIPSDLPLPSAPGITVKPGDGRGFDRQMSWGNQVGRSDQRLRPASAGSSRNLDEKTPFLSHTSQIGRNFDEDERKPLGGVSGPRRTVGDENIRSQSSHVRELNMDTPSGAKVGRPASVPVSQITSGSSGSSYAGRVSELHNMRPNHQTCNYPSISSKGVTITGSQQNAWGVRKEPSSIRDPASTTAWSAPDAAVKLAHASALEKVSSGLWSSKQQVHPLKDAEVFGRQEAGGELEYHADTTLNQKTYNRLDLVGDSGHYDDALVMHTERSLIVDSGIHAGGKGVQSYERARSAIHAEPYEQNTSIAKDGTQARQRTEIVGGTEFEATLPSERPKLKLLPRTKPLETLGQVVDYNQEHRQVSDLHHLENKYAVHEAKSPVQSTVSGPVVADRAPERPKLNLKPRSQSLEQLEGNGEGKRTIFGEARPREVVLKERGIEDDISSYDSQLSSRMKDGAPKAEPFMNASPVHYNEKSGSIPTDQGITKYSDRRDHPVDGEKVDSQRRNGQGDIRRNHRDVEKHRNQQQKQPHDRPPSPETWRKPVEQATPASFDAPPVQYGKVASAVELAQAFSRSVSSNPTTAGRLSGSKGIPGRGNQVPFSRLMGPTPRSQVNGH